MPIPDRQKQRWEYLRKKVRAIGRVEVCRLWLFLGISGVILMLLSAFGIVYSWFRYADVFSDFPFGFFFCVIGLCGLGLLITIFILQSHRNYEAFQDAKKEVAAIVYVPAIIFNNLPAEEVLVRSSQEPEQEQSTVLLRAVEERADTPAEELLRASTSK